MTEYPHSLQRRLATRKSFQQSFDVPVYLSLANFKGLNS